MPVSKSVISRRSFLIKSAGAVALMTYFLASRFYFDVPMFLFATLLMVGAVLFFAWTTAVFQRGEPVTVTPEYGHAAEPWLLAAEDGVLLLPLMFIGINVFTALAASILFTWLLWYSYPRHLALVFGAAYFLVAVWVLPLGIWMVVAAHALAEVTVRVLFRPAPVTGARRNAT